MYDKIFGILICIGILFTVCIPISFILLLWGLITGIVFAKLFMTLLILLLLSFGSALIMEEC